jgi:hypothetical protein
VGPAGHLPCRATVGARSGAGGPSSGGSWQHGPRGSDSSRKVAVMFLLLCGGELLDANKVNGLTGDIVASGRRASRVVEGGSPPLGCRVL